MSIAFGTAANPEGQSYVKLFDQPALSRVAGDAICSVAEAAASGTADEPSRVLIVAGQAGSGKTHLITREFAKYVHPTYGVIVYKPEIFTDFGKWLDQKIAVRLIRKQAHSEIDSSALQQIARSAYNKAFPDSKNKKSSPLARRAGEAFEVFVDAADENPLTRGLKRLARPVSRGHRVVRLAGDFADKMQIREIAEATAFCAALVLLVSPRATEATQIFSSGRVPDSLLSIVKQDSVDRWNLTTLLAHAIGYIGGSLVVFFDQLESMVPRHGDHADSLGSLMAACLTVIQTNKNCGFVISAPPEIADIAIATLQEAEQHRILYPYGVQTVELVRKGETERFFEPRFRFVSDEIANKALSTSLSNFARWIDANGIVVPLPPRLLLAAMHRFAVAQAGRNSLLEDPDMAAVWKSSREKYDPRRGANNSADQKPIDVEQANLVAVDERWLALESEFQRTSPDVVSAADAIQLMNWAISTFAECYQGVSSVSVSEPSHKDGIESLKYTVRFKSGDEKSRELFVLDQVNYGERLLNSLRTVAARRVKPGSVVARLGAKFPTSGKTLVTLTQLKNGKIELVDLLASETICLKQIQVLRSEFSSEQLKSWFRSKAFVTPTLTTCLRY